MRTLRIKLYKYNELKTEQAKEKAIESYRNYIDRDHSDIYDEAYQLVKKFHDIFGTKEGSKSWLEVSTSHIDDNIMNLEGLRLRTYIINNFYSQLITGKYYFLWSKTEVTFKHYKEGYPVLKQRYSKVFFNRSCPLTGICWDQSLLQPIYDFIDWKDKPDYNSYMDFDTLMNDCISELEKDIDSEAEARNSDEYLAEELSGNDYEFTKDGDLYTG